MRKTEKLVVCIAIGILLCISGLLAGRNFEKNQYQYKRARKYTDEMARHR